MSRRHERFLALALAAAVASLLFWSRTSSRPSRSPIPQPAPTDDLAEAPALPAEVEEARELTLDVPLQGQLEPGEIHNYQVKVAQDHFLHIVVDQQGVDIKATLLAPDASPRVVMDRPIDVRGPEPLMDVAETAGIYRVQIVAASGNRPVGQYQIRIEELRPASAVDRAKAQAIRTFSEANALYKRKEYELAAGGFESAQDAWEEIGDSPWQAESLLRLGQTRARLRDWDLAFSHFRRAAELFAQTQNARWQAKALQQQGLAYFFLRDLDNARQSFETALSLRRTAGDRRGEAMTLHTLAHTFQVKDEIQHALEHYSQALKLFEWPKNRAQTNHNLGVLYLSLGRLERAKDALQEAGRFWTEVQDLHKQATTFNQLGELHRLSGDLEKALDQYNSALALRRKLQDRRGEVTSLANIGRVYQAHGDIEKALTFYLEAQTTLKDLQRPRLEARLLLDIASLHLDREFTATALEHYRSSLELYRKVEDPTGEAEALLGIARTEYRQGNFATALEDSESALGIIESIRPKAIAPELRASFFGTVQGHFDFHIDLLMQLHRINPGAGYDARALVASERARARSLLDLLAEAGAKIRRDTTPALLEQEQEAQRQLNAKERERFQLRHQGQARELVAAEKAVATALQQLEEVRVQIRTQQPRYAALTQPLSLREIQDQILDDDTVLLQYRLGETKSYLWILSSDSLESFELPERRQIEDLARKTYDLLLQSQRRESRDSSRKTLCQLGAMLLEPLTPKVSGKRLLIVADGALQFIPFAALIVPGGESKDCWSHQPLVADHEITYLPSASALAIHRRQLKNRPAPTRFVAVVADPVFALENGKGAAARFTDAINTRTFTPLPFSRREADSILELSEENQDFRAVGFDANKQMVTNGLLNNYRFVHFATHGILDAKHPELSGIVLSLVDSDGRPQDGFLRAHEIYNLELASELVVLSACSTALGKVVRGEGLLSLTRGFMYAGAERAMVSLWNVSDESTAQLMERFYHGLLREELRPAAALRAAQMSMWESQERSAPYYWAGFVIQGEWK